MNYLQNTDHPISLICCRITEAKWQIIWDVEPVYKEFKGWKTDMTKFTSEDQFPQEFKDYIAFVEEFLETKIGIISIGPDRAQTIVRK